MSDQHVRKRMHVFHARDAQALPAEMMPREGIDDSVMAGLARLKEANAVEGIGDKNLLLFSEPGEDGMSLLYIWFKSGFTLPFHSHNVDCLYYVLGGELRMGSQVLGKGDGFFVPKGQGYGYEAGPEGVELLEFRNATRFNLKYTSNPQSRWEHIADTFQERRDIWASELPPSER